MKKHLSTLKIMATGAALLFTVTMNAQFTAVMSGDWSNSATWGGTAPSQTVTNQNITIPSGINVSFNQDLTFSGLLSVIAVNGSLTSTTNNWIHMSSGNLTGTGTIDINRLSLTGVAGIAYAGALKLKSFSNSVSSLAFTSVANITDTLELESGSLNLNTNSNLTMASGSTIKVRDGAIVINSGVFNSANAYSAMYLGNTKSSGAELNTTTLQHLHVNLNNGQTLTLGNNLVVNGDLHMKSGSLAIHGKKLTLKGDLMSTSGSMIETNNTSDMVIEGSGALTGALMFNSTNLMRDLTINRTNSGQVKLGSMLKIEGHINLIEGTMSIENGGTLQVNSGATIHMEKGMLSLNSGTFTGMNTYVVEYGGSTDITSGIELSGNSFNLSVAFASSNNKVMLSNHTTVMGSFNMTNGKLDVNGKNLILNGTMTQSNTSWIIGNPGSELHLNLSSVSQSTLYLDNGSQANQTLSKLKVNTTGTTAVVVGSKVFIANELNFIMGKLELGNGDIEIMNAATISGYDDTRYVVTSAQGSGKLIQNVTAGGAYVTYPVGLSTEYSPAYVQQAGAGTTGNFSVKCETLTAANNLKAVNRTWMVEGHSVATINANLKFGWKTTSEINAFDRNNAYVSHYTNGAWDMTAAASATMGAYSTYELSRTGLTSLSPFAVVENGQPLKVNEIAKLEGIDVYPNPSKDVIHVKVTTTGSDFRYEVIDVTGKTILTETNGRGVNKFDVSGLDAGCYFVKITNLDENKTTTKRFVKQ